MKLILEPVMQNDRSQKSSARCRLSHRTIPWRLQPVFRTRKRKLPR